MIEFYAEIRMIHIAAALASGGLFLLRGLLVLRGIRPGRVAPLHWLGYTADTVLFTAALMLMQIVHQFPFVNAWLTVKLLLLGVYLALGVLAFHTQRRTRTRFLLWIAGLAVFGYIYTVARAHHPLGFLAGL